MCGICGIVGQRGAARQVLEGLQRLEYRGYDSCGVAWSDSELRTAKAIGGVANLKLPASGQETIALGHTRWATHGGVRVENAHPHLDCRGSAAIVHNGVILNFEGLRDSLSSRGHRFRSETDSEVLAHLWEERNGKEPIEHLATILAQLRGTYSLAILDQTENAIFAAKERNPLWVGATAGAGFLASDPVALRSHVEEAIPLEDGDCVRLSAGKIEVFAQHGKAVLRSKQRLADIDEHTDKAGYEHYMLKEIHESPGVLNRIVSRLVSLDAPLIRLGLPEGTRGAKRFELVGAGTSFHACLLGAHYLQRIGRAPAEAHASPEYKDSHRIPEKGSALVALSQSGETLDTLQALKRLQSHGFGLVALTNSPKSSIGRLADHVVPLDSGIEVGVAATKTFLSQAMLLYLMALEIGTAKGVVSDVAGASAARQLKGFPRAIAQTIYRSDELAAMAKSLSRFDHVFILAKDILLPAALEGALKLKEIAYQHAEAYPAGELKHGPFALLEEKTAVIFLFAPGPHEASLRNSLHEVHARGSPTFVLAMEGVEHPGKLATEVVWLPGAPSDLQPLVHSSALHLLSYWIAKARALPIDRPRNLAKSVTVE